MNPVNKGKGDVCKVMMSAFGVVVILSIELLVTAALVFSVIYKSGPVLLLALCSVPLVAFFCLAVKALDRKLTEYQESSAVETSAQGETLLGLMEPGEHERINPALSW